MRPTAHLRVPEETLARAGALGALLAALPAAGVGALAASTSPDAAAASTSPDAAAAATSPAAAAAAVFAGAALIGVLALAATPLYRMGSAVGDQAMVAAHMAALGLRLLLGGAIFAALASLTAVPMTPFAAGVAVGLVASIIAEMVGAARDPRFFWVVTPTSASTPATSSNSVSERQRA